MAGGGGNRSAGLASIGMAHKFVLTAGSFNLGAWSKVAGLAVKWDPVEHRIGNSDQYFKYAGIPKFDRLKLARAAESAGTMAVKSWLEKVAASGGTPESGSLKIFTPAGTQVMIWTLKEMFPISWQISEFDASASKVAIESLEIIYGGFLTHTWRV